MSTVKEARTAILNRVAIVLGKDASKFIEILSGDDSAELPEGFTIEDEQIGNIITTEFAMSDKDTYDLFHKKATGEFLEGFDRSTRKIIADSLSKSDAFGKSSINRIMGAFDDPKHERSTNRIFAVLEELGKVTKEQIAEAGTAPDDLKQKFQQAKERAESLQAVVDSFDGKLSDTLSAKEKEWNSQILEMALTSKAKDLGAKFPSERAQRYWAMEMLEKADWKRQNGELVAYQKGTENPLTDPSTKTTIKPEDFIKSDLVDFIPRNNGNGGADNPPKNGFTPGKQGGDNGGLPEHIKPGTPAAENYRQMIERQKRRKEALGA